MFRRWGRDTLLLLWVGVEHQVRGWYVVVWRYCLQLLGLELVVDFDPSVWPFRLLLPQETSNLDLVPTIFTPDSLMLDGLVDHLHRSNCLLLGLMIFGQLESLRLLLLIGWRPKFLHIWWHHPCLRHNLLLLELERLFLVRQLQLVLAVSVLLIIAVVYHCRVDDWTSLVASCFWGFNLSHHLSGVALHWQSVRVHCSQLVGHVLALVQFLEHNWLVNGLLGWAVTRTHQVLLWFFPELTVF
jgi:hypothetical protein